MDGTTVLECVAFNPPLSARMAQQQCPVVVQHCDDNINAAQGDGKHIVILVTWEIWKERNCRVFRHQETSATALVLTIKKGSSNLGGGGSKRSSGSSFARLTFFFCTG